MRLMVQSLLADRFKLDAPLRNTSATCVRPCVGEAGENGAATATTFGRDSRASSQPEAQLGSTQPQGSQAGFPAVCGALVEVPASKTGRIRMGERNVSMELIASTLRRWVSWVAPC